MTQDNHEEPLDYEQFEETRVDSGKTPEAVPSVPRNIGGRPRKWPAEMSKSDQRRAKKLGMTPKQAAQRLASGHPLDDLVPPRGVGEPVSATKQFRYEKAEVALYLAKVVIGCEMDYDAAVARLRPKMASQWERVQLAVEIENNENVQMALARLLKAIGIDEESRQQFVKEIWLWFYGEATDLKLQASRILAKIFFGDAPAQQEAPALKIQGFEGGVERLLGGQEPLPVQPQTTEEPKPIETDADYVMKGRHE